MIENSEYYHRQVTAYLSKSCDEIIRLAYSHFGLDNYIGMNAYSDLLAKLPASLINETWIHLTSQKCKLLSEKEASEINPIVESFLKHEVIRYQKKLMCQRGRDELKVGQSVRHLYLSKKYQLYML
ncbi:hypothetical protein RhiirA5_418458 [Rhizophagus irregularis]|uniref:Uncharacterized protein n=1 Tax=Rhizophagus irregularis TaxID=588596 RepID=A0A2I1DZ46_9GLOM|nr:hypothetical protein RhiirA5_418458 [Rhizophagus irregularis]PKY15146.1 hypothetical protein RhiirB3_427294 [Rhizophagus irregularis]GBC34865.2 hypothetical protein GLOIN_2v1826331 [Rhizophagus irregularis DAOM 181602=DAOM 197198]CAG8751511.1 15923_t:CDS:2 [Rhizophagus irregularis]